MVAIVVVRVLVGLPLLIGPLHPWFRLDVRFFVGIAGVGVGADGEALTIEVKPRRHP